MLPKGGWLIVNSWGQNWKRNFENISMLVKYKQKSQEFMELWLKEKHIDLKGAINIGWRYVNWKGFTSKGQHENSSQLWVVGYSSSATHRTTFFGEPKRQENWIRTVISSNALCNRDELSRYAGRYSSRWVAENS